MKPGTLRRGRGLTLIELVAALGVSSVLVVAIASTMALATKGLPVGTDRFSGQIAAARVAEQIAGELETATMILELTPTSITFLVPSRNGDASPERIRYSWSGISNNPLKRQYNNAAAGVMLETVDQFSLTPAIVTSTESYPGLATEDAAESLLIDSSSTSGLSNLNVNLSTYQGQYFGSASWPAGVVGWRPTRITYQGKQSGLIATTNVQLCTASSNFTPNAVLSQTTVVGTGLLASYSTQQFSVGTIDRLSPQAGVCLAFQWVLGTPNSIIVQGNGGSSGLVSSSNGGGTWTYAATSALQAQMYGTLTRSSSTQYATSRYLAGLTIGLRAGGSTAPMVTTTAQALNHPEMLGAYWEAKFDVAPTTLDVNADGTADWAVRGAMTFNVANLVAGTWIPSGASLDSTPGDGFTRLTVIDVRLRGTSAGSWAGVNLNAARGLSTCAPVGARVTLQSDGTQTLVVWRKINDSTTENLLTVPWLAAQPVDLHLVIDPAYGTIAFAANGQQYGAFAYNRYASSDASQAVTLSSSGNAEFSYVRVREAMP